MSNLAVEYIEDFYNAQEQKQLFKHNRKRKRKAQAQAKNRQTLQLQDITPMTANQKLAFTHYDNGDNILLHGVAGTGKTFLSMYLALEEIMQRDSAREKVVIVRSVVPTRDMGFLPGKEHEKTAVYEQPYKAICSEIANRGDAYDLFKAKGMIEFISTSFIRGTTLDNAIVIVDEFQNMTDSEINSVLTRVGVNTRVILCGDFRQTDLHKPYEQSGANLLLRLWGTMGSNCNSVEFENVDIVRSGFVKDWIEARDAMGLV